MGKNIINGGSASIFIYMLSASVVLAQDTYKVIGEQTYMAAESNILWGTKWVPRSVDGIAVIENGTVRAEWDVLPKEYPTEWVTDMGGGHCRVTHEKMPTGVVFTYQVSDGTKFFKINTETRKKSYMKFRCAK